MRRTGPTLPVPAPWQAPVRATLAEARERHACSESEMTVTRVEPGRWSLPDGDGGTRVRTGLDVWLMIRGETVRYRVATDGAAGKVEVVPTQGTASSTSSTSPGSGVA